NSSTRTRSTPPPRMAASRASRPGRRRYSTPRARSRSMPSGGATPSPRIVWPPPATIPTPATERRTLALPRRRRPAGDRLCERFGSRNAIVDTDALPGVASQVQPPDAGQPPVHLRHDLPMADVVLRDRPFPADDLRQHGHTVGSYDIR